MKVRYFADTDTLLIEFRDVLVAETRDLDENTILDLDAHGNIPSSMRRNGLMPHSFPANRLRHIFDSIPDVVAPEQYPRSPDPVLGTRACIFLSGIIH